MTLMQLLMVLAAAFPAGCTVQDHPSIQPAARYKPAKFACASGSSARHKFGHERLLHNAGVDAEPIPELEFDQTLGW